MKKDINKKIVNLVEQIRPYLNSEGGDLEFIKYEDGYVYVKMIGACANCLYQDSTLNDGLLNYFQEEIPEIKGIINVPLT